MLKFIKTTTVPIGGYTFKDPDTGFDFGKHKTFDSLELHVHTYREQNRLDEISEFRTVWEAYVCSNIPQMRKLCCPVAESVKRKFTQYFSGAKAYIRAAFMQDDAFVDQETADYRASVCGDCTNNVRNIGHSHSQFYTDKFMRAQVGARKTPYDKDLFTCRICTCLNRAKVHYRDDIVADSLKSSEIARMRTTPRSVSTGTPLRCWQLEAVDNVRNKK